MTIETVRETKREYWVDFLKGIAIVLVVLGHCDLPGYLRDAIYLFHMPLFFMISGYLDNSHREANLWNVVKKKAPRLLWPYLTYGVIVILWKTLINIGAEGNFTALLGKRILAFVYGNHIWENNYDYIGTLWFLVGLFCVICISWLLHRIRSEKIRLAITAAVALFGALFSKLLLQWNVRLPWALDVALVAILFYELGIWWKQHRKCTDGKALLWASLSLMVGFGLGACNIYLYIQEPPRIGMLDLTFGNVPLFFISVVLICLGFMMVTSCLYSRRGSKLVEYMGRQSLVIMVAHRYILSVLVAVGNRIVPGVSAWVYFLLTTAMSVFAAFIVEKKLPFLNDFRYVKKIKCK